MAEDAEAICRVLAGDVDSFRCLVERHAPTVFRLAAALLGDEHLGEDISQEAFLAAYRNLSRFDANRASFATWLLTIARNLCLSAMRRKWPAFVEDPSLGSCPRTPQDDLSEREWMDRLDAALETLPVAQRTAFVLAEFLDLPYDQVAQIEGTKPATARANASKARRRLRLLLHEFSGGVT